MLIAVLSGFIVALCLPLLGKYLKGKLSIALAALPVLLFIYFLSFIPEIAAGTPVAFSYSWIPSYGINLDFNLDGLALLFTLLITGIGSLVFLYTSAYLKGHEYLDRFYGFLSVYMGSMLGLVLSDTIMSLFVFLEWTSLSSFFLLGLSNDIRRPRR